MRTIAGVAVAGALLVSLTACSTPSADAACTPDDTSKLISASGDFRANPEVEFPTPLVAESTGVSTLIEGDGDPVPEGGIVGATLYLYDGESGQLLLDGDEQAQLFPTANFPFPFTEAMQCGNVGSRIVASGTGAELFGDRAEQLQLDPDATYVMSADIVHSFLGRANGADQLAESGMPAIVLAPTGQPGFTFPDAPAPTELTVDLLKKGSGAEAKTDDQVVIHFSSVRWRGDELVESTWGASPAPVLLTEGADAGTLPPEVVEALVGQTVGSQLLIAVPGDQTLVYVVDLLGIAE